MNWKRIGLVTAGLILAWVAGWAIITFSDSEEKQLLKKQQAFITALENRKWSTVDGMICKDYDDGAMDATEVKAAMRKVLGGFYALSITPESTTAQVAHGLGVVKSRLKIEGTGTGLSAMVITEARHIKKPWNFHWHKRGFWPWSWELVQVYNEDMMVPPGALEQ